MSLLKLGKCILGNLDWTISYALVNIMYIWFNVGIYALISGFIILLSSIPLKFPFSPSEWSVSL